MIEIRDTRGAAAADCAVGFLMVSGVGGAAGNALAAERKAAEDALRAAYGNLSRADLKRLSPMDAYVGYYKKFGYSYHVLGQLESVLKGKGIPDVPPPVEAMFMAELTNMLLTAGHDLDKIEGALEIARADEHESYVTMGGRVAAAVPGDVLVRDGADILSSILRGPDGRTAISAETDRVLYVVYAPAGVREALVRRHLDGIAGTLRRIGADAAAETAIF